MADYIVGVHDGHNAAAAILKDGELLYAVQEERLVGRKNHTGFPRLAIEACLQFAGIAAVDVAELAFASFRRTPTHLRSYDQVAAATRDSSLYGFLRRLLGWYPVYVLNSRLGLGERLRLAGELGFTPHQCQRYDHHLGHAATAYYGLRQDVKTPYVVVTIDGNGDLNCATVYTVEDGTLSLLARTPMGHSIGSIYGIITGAMGFTPQEHEYKLMGMAPYASPRYAQEAADAFRRLLTVDKPNLRLRRKTWEPTFCYPRRLRRLISGMRFDNVCAGLQLHCEEVVADLVQAALQKTGIRRVLCAGGVFMNVKANKRIMELPEVDYLAVVPSAGDESLCMGVAWQACVQRGGTAASERIAPFSSLFLGPDIDEDEAESLLKGSGHPYTRHEDIERETADVLANGHPVARCKGRLEFGARALGNRSILADPSNHDMVRVINQMVKKRDFWMPFAPVVRRERMQEYFVNSKDLPSPYMMLTFDTRDNFRDLIAAVHNADLTARAQVLEKSHNAEYYRILQLFEQHTGRGVLLNTSFNLHGLPLVRGPQEALHVFQNSGLNHLALGPFMVTKRS